MFALSSGITLSCSACVERAKLCVGFVSWTFCMDLLSNGMYEHINFTPKLY